MLLVEAWRGRHPLAGLPPAEQLAHLHDGTLCTAAAEDTGTDYPFLHAFLACALARDPGERLTAAAAFLRALDAIV